MMTINDLRDIFQQNNIMKQAYSLSEQESPLIETVLCLRSNGDKYQFYASDRDEKIDEKVFESEDAACRYFLQEMADEYHGLKKYIP